MSRTLVQLAPRDGMFLKDGRGWYSNQANTPSAFEWPSVGTVRGAMRTGLGRVIERNRGASLVVDKQRNEWAELTSGLHLGAMLGLCRPYGAVSAAEHRMWHRPMDLALVANEDGQAAWRLLQPRRADVSVYAGAASEAAALATMLWPGLAKEVRAKPIPAPTFITEEDLGAWLSGDLAKMSGDNALRSGMENRVDVRLAMEPDRGVGQDAMLFATRTLEPLTFNTNHRLHEWSLAVEAKGVDVTDLIGQWITLGADRRPACAEACPASLFEPPNRLLEQVDRQRPRGLRLLVVCPAWFRAGWRPEAMRPSDLGFIGRFGPLDGLRLRSACTSRPQHVSGWDMQHNRPKRTRRLVPAGAVFFVDKVDGSAFTADEVKQLWLADVGDQSDDGQSYGQVVAGAWSMQPSS